MNKYIITVMAGMLFLSSCEDFLEEKTYGLIRPTDYFNTTEDLEKTVNSLYSYFNTMFNETATMTPCMGGDDVTTQSGFNKAGYLQFDIFNAQDNNDRFGKMWNACYGLVKQSNIIIQEIDNFTEPVDQPDFLEAQKIHALGQAHFFRAVAYFFLVRMWGQVPLITEVGIHLEAEKASFEDIYSTIVSDLQLAEQYLPTDYLTDPHSSNLEKNSAYARPKKSTAKALIASVYLNMAGYPLKDNSKYRLAAAKAKEVIDNENSNGYRLLPDFKELWLASNNINSETILGCYYNHTAPVWDWSSGNMTAPMSYKPGDVGGWDDLFAELNFFYEFPEGPRKNATFLTEVKTQDGTVVKSWENFITHHPYYKKWLDIPGYDENNMDVYIDWWSSRTMMVMRYAEVLLIYAEAKARADGPDLAAYDAVNRIRQRAGLDDLTPELSTSEFVSRVIEERAWEFAGNEPCARWFDMVRTETVESASAKRHPDEIPLTKQPTKDEYFAPIPQGDRFLNQNL